MSAPAASVRGSSLSGQMAAVTLTGRDELVALLAQALGVQQASDLVSQAAQRAGLSGSNLTIDQMLLILDNLAAQGGTASIVARFAKVRLILKKPA